MPTLLTAGATAGLVAVAATTPAWVAAAVGAAWAVLEQQGRPRVLIVPATKPTKVSEEGKCDAKQVKLSIEEKESSLGPHWTPAEDKEEENFSFTHLLEKARA